MSQMKYLLSKVQTIFYGLSLAVFVFGGALACDIAEIDVNGNGTLCEPTKFSVTTTNVSADTPFVFSLAASGTFYVDCGDGGTLNGGGVSGNTIARTDTDVNEYSCTWNNDGVHTIGFAGQASGYSTTDNVAAISFYGGNKTPDLIASINGSLGAIFSTIGNGGNGYQPRFFETFRGAVNLGGSVPATLFNGVTGAPVSRMFNGTFRSTNLQNGTPSGLFSGLNGAPTYELFANTWRNCLAMTAPIPGDLFAGIVGAPASRMFFGTFAAHNNDSGQGWAGENGNITGSIPATLFSGISGAPAISMFEETFCGQRWLTGAIPGELFAGIDGAPARNMFMFTFNGCARLSGLIPENLFAGIQGPAAQYMYGFTFRNCTSLTGQIPEDLFAGVTGSASHIFYQTFANCSGLTGPIPENLFAGITGTPKASMFFQTFRNCTGLTGSIPENLFAGIVGAPASYMFAATFANCSSLNGFISPQLFKGISTETTAASQMSSIFSGTGLDTECPTGYVQYITGFESDFGDKVSCSLPQVCTSNEIDVNGDGSQCEATKFSVTTTNDATYLIFRVNAALDGRFYHDCGEGVTSTTTSEMVGNITYTVYRCDWGTAGEHTIRFGGQIVGAYGGSGGAVTIAFNSTSDGPDIIGKPGGSPTKIASVSGSLADIFPNANNGANFSGTFAGCTNLTNVPDELFWGLSTGTFSGTFAKSGLTVIPDDLFKDITTGTQSMFSNTFSECINLTEIPDELFGNINVYDTNARLMFSGTFAGCTGLTSIPADLFSGINISGVTSTNNMFEGTFSGCTGVTTIPTGLFDTIDTSNSTNTISMFYNTFSGCSGLTGSIPLGLFDAIDTSKSTNTSYMFYGTFSGCSSLTGSIPSGLFDAIDTSKSATTSFMFYNTFLGCSGLTGSIPSGLFDAVDTSSTTSMNRMFYGTFMNCSGLTGGIPSGLFDGIIVDSSTSTITMFQDTFYGCSGLTSIPSGLFKGIRAPGQSMFYRTFSGTGISSIPSGLFDNITTGTSQMFYGTFAGCSNLTTVPSGLFSKIITGADSMFYNTFLNDSKLSTIPDSLFAGITGAASSMFRGTFSGCNNLSGYIPPSTFAGLIANGSPNAVNMWYDTFRVTQVATSCPDGMRPYVTGYEGDTNGDTWNGKVSCEPGCVPGMTLYAGTCHAMCPANNELHIGNMSYPVFADKTNITQSSLHIKGLDGTICYVYLEPDAENEAGVRIKGLDGSVYRIIDPR